MTDIKRHLPEITKLVRRELNAIEPDQTSLSETQLSDIREKLAELLPDSYGITAGRLANRQGKVSRPLELILYDKTISKGNTNRPGLVEVSQALLVVELAMQSNEQAFTEMLDRIRSAKKLRPFSVADVLNGENKAIPKQLFPLGLIMFQRWQSGSTDTTSGEKLVLELHRLIKNVGASVGEQPDYIYALEAALAYRNPIMEGFTPADYQLGFYREPNPKKPLYCYVCRTNYTRRHFFYDSLCPECGDFNYVKRGQTADLTGKIALVTGARLKIGYATVLHLLRAGATVLATSRFPHDTAQRYAQEPDFAKWSERLHIYGLDLRYLPGVEAFVRRLFASYPRLDILINNAAQTVWRPSAFYAHLLPFEELSVEELPEPLQPMLSHSPLAESLTVAQLSTSETVAKAAELSKAFSAQLAVLQAEDQTLFPLGQYNQYGEQLDLRDQNSWTQPLEEISMPEMVEVQLVNAVAPAMLVSQLKDLMLKNPPNLAKAGYIINVSAMEGQFAHSKTGHHPHTNMAKAALNMLTHTSAAGYAQSGIFMNSVDPGFVSEQVPVGKENGRAGLPLDMIDAAARICDPIFLGEQQAQPDYGLFLKDYRPAQW